MNERSGLVRRLCVVAVVGLALATVVGALIRPAEGAAGTPITVQGTFVFKFFMKGGFSKSCVPNPDGSDTMICWINATGAFYGGVSGGMTWNTTTVVTPGHPMFTATGTGSVRCSSCTVAGLSGDINFSVSWVSDVQLTGRLTVLSATGELKGLAGSGPFGGTNPGAASPYVLELTLPS